MTIDKLAINFDFQKETFQAYYLIHLTQKGKAKNLI